MNEEKKGKTDQQELLDPISTTGTVRDALEAMKDDDVVLVIPIGGAADEFE